MINKQDAYYFDNFIACLQISCQEAALLKEILIVFRPLEMPYKLKQIHELERAADDKKHELTDRLAKAFITPIEREDIAELSQNIDELADKIEEVLIRIYINNVQSIRPEALHLLDIVIQCCTEVYDLLRIFPEFKHPATLKEHIIHINSLEEDADQLYMTTMRELHTQEKNVLLILAWREIYSYLEKCADACEHIADTVGMIIMKNS